ncbi:cupin domain-containing protein [Vallitalea okinawensis]|uniref:cupin domain-containing protein n=1 Tax=Vallitalea okinawensis TaxID=2078660 RepID=UPI000CFCFB2A|nr:cupin domain-containing protein [Vallitalea okinawensis]
MFQKFEFTQTEDDLFENILKTEDMLLNHVVMEVGKAFPRHATDAEVFMIINKGEVTVELEVGSEQTFSAGQVLNIPMGTETTLSNKSQSITELFVIKRM